METTMDTFLASADSRETSIELMKAILWVANYDETHAVRIWERPTDFEVNLIRGRLLSRGIDDAEENWGAAGNMWHVGA